MFLVVEVPTNYGSSKVFFLIQLTCRKSSQNIKICTCIKTVLCSLATRWTWHQISGELVTKYWDILRCDMKQKPHKQNLTHKVISRNVSILFFPYWCQFQYRAPIWYQYVRKLKTEQRPTLYGCSVTDVLLFMRHGYQCIDSCSQWHLIQHSGSMEASSTSFPVTSCIKNPTCQKTITSTSHLGEFPVHYRTDKIYKILPTTDTSLLGQQENICTTRTQNATCSMIETYRKVFCINYLFTTLISTV